MTKIKSLFAVLLMATASTAFATSTTETKCSTCGGTDVEAKVEGTATSDATNSGVNQEINFNSPEKQHVEYSGTQTIKNVPSMNAPSLASSNDTCMGSTSGGVAVAGFGLSLGSTWTDKNCTMLKNSRELWNMGMKAASLARMCMDDLNKEALELTGFVCPTKKEAK